MLTMLKYFTASLLLCCASAIACASPLPDYPFVTTSGKAQAWLKPDTGEIHFDVTAQHLRADAAFATLEQVCQVVLQLLADAGVPQRDIEQFEVSKKPVDLSRPADDGSLQAVAITRHFTITLRELDKFPAIMTGLTAQNNLDALSVKFDRSDRDQIETGLALQAAKDARNNGAALAEAFGRKLGAVQGISLGTLTKIGAPFGLADIERSASKASAPRAPDASSYRVPDALPFQQAVNVIFRLK